MPEPVGPAAGDRRELALLGLGRMGEPMARRLLAVHPGLVVWNRSAGKADALAGATVAASPVDAAAEVTLTVFTDLADVEAVLDQLRAGWVGVERPVLVVHGTVSPPAVAALADRLDVEGIGLVDAPLSGGVAGAEAGTLSIMVGGRDHDVARVLPYLAAVGRTVRHVGGPGSGQLAKACNQIVVAATVTALSEALVLADAAGIERATLLELLGGGLAGSEVLRQKADRWVDHDFEGGGSSANQLKDLRFVAAAAAGRGLDLPLGRTLLRVFETAVETDGEGALDHSGVIRSLERHARVAGSGS